jgi:chromosome segregation ATPase
MNKVLETQREYHDRMDRLIVQGETASRREAERLKSEMSKLLPASLTQAVQGAETALATAQADARQAEQALQAHIGNRPATGDQVPEWARRRVELETELSAYRNIEQQALAHLEQARAQMDDFYVEAWQRALAETRAGIQQAKNEYQTALDRLAAEHQQRTAELGRRLHQLQQITPEHLRQPAARGYDWKPW